MATLCTQASGCCLGLMPGKTPERVDSWDLKDDQTSNMDAAIEQRAEREQVGSMELLGAGCRSTLNLVRLAAMLFVQLERCNLLQRTQADVIEPVADSDQEKRTDGQVVVSPMSLHDFEVQCGSPAVFNN